MIFVVMAEADYSPSCLVGVFDTREQADQCREAQNKKSAYYFEVYEVALNEERDRKDW